MTLEFPPGRGDCRQIEALLPPFVDGLAIEHDAARVRTHLERCEVCRSACEVQRVVRRLLRGRQASLCASAPAGFDARLRLLAATPTAARIGLGGRLSALAAAAAVVLAAGGVVAWGTGRSSVLLAAQLTLDHIKCFIVDGDDHGAHTTAAAAEAQIQAQYGVAVHVPALPARADVSLVAVRRCLYADGMVAHVLYRFHDEPVSLFIIPGRDGAAVDIAAFGRHTEVLVRRGVTYVLVAPARLAGVAAAVGLEAE